MKHYIRFVCVGVLSLLIFTGCGESGQGNQNGNGHGNAGGNHGGIERTTAYFGDKENNLALVVDVENMQLIDAVATGHEKTYALEEIKTEATRHDPYHKMYIANRGSDAIDVFDPQSNTIIKTIGLSFHPRSIDVEKETGLVAVSGSDKPMTAIIDSRNDNVIATVGENVVTYPTTSGHSYVSSGTLASGHPHWIDATHFVLIDRQKREIITYTLTQDSDGTWHTEILNKVTTPSPVHNLIPPEVHGQHGSAHHNQYTSTIFYATAEGAEDVYPSVLKLSFTPDSGLEIVDELLIQKEGVDVNVMGVHHLNFLKDQQHIYVGSDEGTLFIVDYTVTPMKIVKSVPAGKGAGHTDEMKHGDIAVVINHKDLFITVMDTLRHEKIADITVSALPQVGSEQTQSHPQYHFSKDGRYFYLFLTEEGALVKVDLEQRQVVERLDIGGKIAMGTFVSEH